MFCFLAAVLAIPNVMLVCVSCRWLVVGGVFHLTIAIMYTFSVITTESSFSSQCGFNMDLVAE